MISQVVVFPSTVLYRLIPLPARLILWSYGYGDYDDDSGDDEVHLHLIKYPLSEMPCVKTQKKSNVQNKSYLKLKLTLRPCTYFDLFPVSCPKPHTVTVSGQQNGKSI